MMIMIKIKNMMFPKKMFRKGNLQIRRRVRNKEKFIIRLPLQDLEERSKVVLLLLLPLPPPSKPRPLFGFCAGVSREVERRRKERERIEL